jgi:hypothetical protein
MCCGRQAEKLGATGFERINRNGLVTEKAQSQLLMEAIPDNRLGAPSPFSCGRGSPLPSVLVDPFNSVDRRFSASPPACECWLAGWSLFVPKSFTRDGAEVSAARANQNDLRSR